MHKIILSLFFLLAAPAAAYASAESCMPAGPDAGYVQRGDDILLIECPAMEGAACTCHEPPGENGECRSFECNADGSPKVAEVKPAPLALEEKAAPPPKAEEPKVKRPAKKKKAKAEPVVEEKKTEAAPAPVEEKKAEAPPVQEEAKPAPAPAPAATGEKKIEYTR